jgi:hypothetical protein
MAVEGKKELSYTINFNSEYFAAKLVLARSCFRPRANVEICYRVPCVPEGPINHSQHSDHQQYRRRQDIPGRDKSNNDFIRLLSRRRVRERMTVLLLE